MNLFLGTGRFTRDSIHGIHDATNEVARGNIESAMSVLTGKLTVIDAFKKNTGHAIAATSLIVSPIKFISLATQATDCQLLAPLAEFKKILYDRCDDYIEPADMELALFVLVTLQNHSLRPLPEMDECRPASDAKFAEFKHWMKHATTVYGRNLLIHNGYVLAGCKDDKDWIAHFTGVQRADIIRYEDANDVHNTDLLEYYLALDRAKSAVVLAIKGTLSLRGVMVDLDCSYMEHNGYTYHRGMLTAARAIIKRIKDDITRALMENPTFKLVTCGHSLGAGTAAIVAQLLSRRLPDGRFLTWEGDRDIHCYGIETAPAMCFRASTDYQGLISTLVHKNDIVPSLSDGLVNDIKSYAGYLKGNRSYLGELLCKAVGIISSFGDSKEAAKYLDTFRQLATHEKLVPPGTIYIMAKKDRLRYGRVRDTAVAKHFGEARFVIGMLTDHFLFNINETMGNFI